MKKMFKLTAIAAALMAQGVAYAAPTHTQVVSVVVVDTIDVVQDTPMAFPQIAVNGATQTIASGTDAAYSVNGANNGSYSISTTGTSSELTRVAGTETIAFTATPSDTSDTLDGAGAGTFTVDGEVTVGATQAGGTYEGNLVVTVAYAAAPDEDPTFPPDLP